MYINHRDTYLSVNFLNVVVDAQFMAFRIGSNGTIRVPTHRDLVWLNKSDLAILIQYSERVSLCLEDNTDSLQTEGISVGAARHS